MMSSSSIMQQPFSGSSNTVGELSTGQSDQTSQPRANGQASGGSQAHPPSAGSSATGPGGDIKPNVSNGPANPNGTTGGDQLGIKGRKRSASPMERAGPPGSSGANGAPEAGRNDGPAGGISDQPRPMPGGGAVPAGGYDGRPNKFARTETMGPGSGPRPGFNPNTSVPFNLSAPPRMMPNGPGGQLYPAGPVGSMPRNGPPLYTMSAPGPDGRGRGTDLFAPQELRARLAGLSKDMGVAFSPESLVFLSLGAEQRIRGLLAAALSAQLHRTSTTHLHAPPISKPNKASTLAESAATGKPLWSHRVTNDVNSVMDLLNKSSGETEREFRINRMSRLAREQQEDRLERAERARLGLDAGGQARDVGGAGGATVPEGGTSGPASDDASSSAGPSTPRDKSDRPSFAPRSSTAPDGTPIFGAVKEREKASPGTATPTSSSKKRKKDAFNSADVAIRSTNATALALSGMKKKYAWMGSQVHVSSPLAGKKAKKAGKDMFGEGDAAESGAADGDGDVDMGGGGGAGAMPGTPVPSKASKKSRLRESMVAGDGSSDSPLRPSSKNASRSKVRLSAPSRRTVIVDRGGNTGGGAPGQRQPVGLAGRPGTPQNEAGERRVPDNEALTMVDVVFALEKGALGMGMGTAADIVKRVWNRPGGPYGRDAITGDQPRRP